METIRKCKLCNKRIPHNAYTKQEYCNTQHTQQFFELKKQIANRILIQPNYDFKKVVVDFERFLDFNLVLIFEEAKEHTKKIRVLQGDFEPRTQEKKQRFGLISEDEILAAMEKRSIRNDWKLPIFS